MKVLLDETIVQRFWRRLGNHECRTVAHMGWRQFKNGELLQLAEAQGFHVSLTADQNLAYQQNLSGRRIAIVVLNTNNRALLEGSLALIVEAITAAEPDSFQEIDCRQRRSYCTRRQHHR